MEEYLPIIKIMAPLCMLFGGVLLFFCIRKIRRMVFPKTCYVFEATTQDNNITLPTPGRYVISVVIPPLKKRIGFSHINARFLIEKLSIRTEPIEYRANSRFNPFSVIRSDMRGNKSIPLGSFDCTEHGKYRVTCVTPELIKPEFKLEVAPYINPAIFGIMVPLTILGAMLTLGGFIIMVTAYTKGF